MASISLKNINKIYPNNVQAVFDFNIDIKDKEFIVFVGPSGCGKSTTLRMIAGLEDISSGELLIDGQLMNSVAPKDRNIAMVFQNYALYPHLSVYKNMKFALKLRKVFKPDYLPNPEIQPLIAKRNELLKQIKLVNKKAKKLQDVKELLGERKQLYDELYKNEELIESKLVVKMGIDKIRIRMNQKKIASIKKELKYYTKLYSAYKDRKDSNVEFLLSSNEKRELMIDNLIKENEMLATTEVPLNKYRHLTKLEMDIEINKVAESIDLIRYLYRKPGALSGGQRQRVALGRAIVRKPKVFLMDEPLSNLDAKLRVQTRSEISKIHDRVGATTIYVTHDQTEAMTMADRIVIMKDGYIQQIGTPNEVYYDPFNKFVGGFIGSPSMNFIDGLFKDGHFLLKNNLNELNISLDDKSSKLLNKYQGKNVTLGIRPEDIYLATDKTESCLQPIEIIANYVEVLGSELVVYTELANQKLVFKAKFKENIKEGDKLKICFDSSRLYFFDVDSTNRIR